MTGQGPLWQGGQHMLEFSGTFRPAGAPWPEEWGRPWSRAGPEVMARQQGVCAVQAGPCAICPWDSEGRSQAAGAAVRRPD